MGGYALVMTEREQLHQLVEEVPDDRAGDALEAMRLIARAPRRTGRPGFVGIANTGETDLGHRAKDVLRAELGEPEAA
jgi:hypothetical protein